MRISFHQKALRVFMGFKKVNSNTVFSGRFFVPKPPSFFGNRKIQSEGGEILALES